MKLYKEVQRYDDNTIKAKYMVLRFYENQRKMARYILDKMDDAYYSFTDMGISFEDDKGREYFEFAYEYEDVKEANEIKDIYKEAKNEYKSASVEKENKEEETVETPSAEQKGNYTALEMLVIKNFENGFNYGELENELADNACVLSFNELKPKGYSNKQVRGVVSSLIKKGLLFFDDWDGIDSCYPFRITELGLIEYYKLFRHDDYEKCPSAKDVIKEWT